MLTRFSDAYMRHRGGDELIDPMAAITSVLYVAMWSDVMELSTQIANTLEVTSIRYRFDAKVTDRCQINVDPMVFSIWECVKHRYQPHTSKTLNYLRFFQYLEIKYFSMFRTNISADKKPRWMLPRTYSPVKLNLVTWCMFSKTD